TAIHPGTAIRPEHLFLAVELALVENTGAAPTILTVREHQVADLVDAAGILPNQYFRGRHANIRRARAGGMQRREPASLGFRVVIEQGNIVAARGGNSLVVGRAEAAIFAVAEDHRTELPFSHF